MKWFYCTVARVPGVKAHCAQIAQMCRSFLNVGNDLELLQPARKDLAVYQSKSIREWYGIDIDIPSRKLPCIDLLSRLPAGLTKPVYQVAFQLLVGTYNRSLRRVLRQHHGDGVVYSRDVHVFSKLIDAFPSLTKVVELHNLDEPADQRLGSEARVWGGCNGVVVITSHLKDMLIDRGCNADRILVEANGVDAKAFPGTATKNEAREALSLPGEGKIVAYVGNFHTLGLEKGIGMIVEAVPTVLKEYQDVTFYFVGGPLACAEPYSARLEGLGVSGQHYRFVDRQPYKQMHLWLAAADILVMPLPDHPRFTRVTSPMKVFEYMTSGRPMIVSDLPALRDVLSNEQNALMVPPGNNDSFAQAVVRLLQDQSLADTLSHNAQRDVRYRTWDARAKRISDWANTLH